MDNTSTDERATSTTHRVVKKRWITDDPPLTCPWADSRRHHSVRLCRLVPYQPGAAVLLRNHTAAHDRLRPGFSRGRCAHLCIVNVELTWLTRPNLPCAHQGQHRPYARARAVREIIDTLARALRKHGCEDVVCVVNMSDALGASPFALPCVAGFVVSHRYRSRLR